MHSGFYQSQKNYLEKKSLGKACCLPNFGQIGHLYDFQGHGRVCTEGVEHFWKSPLRRYFTKGIHGDPVVAENISVNPFYAYLWMGSCLELIKKHPELSFVYEDWEGYTRRTVIYGVRLAPLLRDFGCHHSASVKTVVELISKSVFNSERSLRNPGIFRQRGVLMQPSFIIKIHLSPWSSSSLDRLMKRWTRLISCCSFVPRCLTVFLRKFICCQPR